LLFILKLTYYSCFLRFGEGINCLVGVFWGDSWYLGVYFDFWMLVLMLFYDLLVFFIVYDWSKHSFRKVFSDSRVVMRYLIFDITFWSSFLYFSRAATCYLSLVMIWFFSTDSSSILLIILSFALSFCAKSLLLFVISSNLLLKYIFFLSLSSIWLEFSYFMVFIIFFKFKIVFLLSSWLFYKWLIWFYS